MKIITMFVVSSMFALSYDLLSSSDLENANDDVTNRLNRDSANDLNQDPANDLNQDSGNDQPAINDEGEDNNFYNSPGMAGGGGGGGSPRWGGGGGGGGGGGRWGGPRTWYKPWTWFNPSAPPPDDPNKFVGGGGNAEIEDLQRRVSKLEKLLGKPLTPPDTGPKDQ